MSEYAKNIQTIEDMCKKRIELRDGGGRMSEFIYASNGEPLANSCWEIALARHEIVRCRDCKYHETIPEDSGDWCGYWTDRIYADARGSGFCAWGERRET